MRPPVSVRDASERVPRVPGLPEGECRSARHRRSGASRPRRRCAGAALALLAALAVLAAPQAGAKLPRPVGRAFLEAGVPLNAVSIVVQQIGRPPLFAYDPERSMNPASVMKLVTTFAALELLGPDFRWKTEAYLGGPLEGGTLRGDLVLKGYGDPKITVEQWQAFMADLRGRGLATVTGDLVLDRTQFRLPPHDPEAFDGEPLKPYNVGPDALLLSFKSVRFVFTPNAAGDGVDVRIEPPLPQVTLDAPPQLGRGTCEDWQGALRATFTDGPAAARVAFAGRYPASCAERDWYVALLDAPHFALGMFTTYFREAGGRFDGDVKEGRAPAGAAPFATLESPPLYEVVRDINKRSNNVMARQLFLTLGTATRAPPVGPADAIETVRQWLARRKLRMPGLVLENGAGLSREARVTAGGLARLLLAANASAVHTDFANSLAVAAVDGTVQRRFQNGSVAGQALLKTGTLEGVRALAGYVIDAGGRWWVVVALINHPNAARGRSALDYLVQWVYHDAAAWRAILER
jgi:D-alanyl-D-alanine carboxypeptidase/D-alanyl-D-alanine-endopeptidase (penicillin-binding protein 4)